MALKRSRSPQSLAFPELPKLSGDTLLLVFTHPSLRRADQEPFDNARLSLLGHHFLQLLIIHVCLRPPFLTVSEIEANILSVDNITFLVRHYGLLNHLRCHPDKIATLNEPQEAYSIFYAYIGGIFLDYGDDGPLREIVQTWIELLGSDTESSQHAPKKIKTEFMESQIVPPPSESSGPTMTTARVQTQALSNPLAPSQPDSSFLKSFNEAAAKRGALVNYPATEGTGNEGRWIVQCVVNGITKGTASGASKKIAQDLAARRAFDALGWA